MRVCGLRGAAALRAGVVSVAAGSLHTVAATADGRCLAWGCNEAGQLGVQLTEQDEDQPFVQA